MADNFEEEFQEEETDGSDSEESNYETCSDDDDDDSEYEEAEESQSYEDAGEEADGDKERPEDDNDAELDMSLNDADDSNVNDTDCPICLMSLNGQQLGSPNKCDHVFCFLCISEWSKNSNTCPVDRKKFDYIEVSMTNKGPIIKKIKVEDKHVPNDQEWEQAPTYCEVCNRCHREASMLLCDGCDKGYHLYCLDPPLRRVPLGDWYCDTCLVIRNENNLQSLEGSAVPDLVQELRTSTTCSLSSSIDSSATSSSRGRPSSSRGRGRGRPRSGSTTSTHRRSRSKSTRGRGVSRRGRSKTKTSKRSKTASTTGKRKRKTKRSNKRRRKTTKKSSAKKRKTEDNKAYHMPFQSSTIPGRTSSDTGRGPGTSTALSIYGDEYALHDFEAEDTVHKDISAASTCSNNNQTSTDVLGSIFDCFEVLHDTDARVSRDGSVLPSESPDNKSPSKKPENSPEKSKTSSDVKSHDTITSEKSRDTGVEQSVQSTTRKKPSTSPEQKHDRNSTTNSTTTDIDKRKNEKDTKQKTVSWSSDLSQQSSPSADPAILPAEEPLSKQKRPCSPSSGDFVPLCKHIKTESLSDPYEPPAKPCQKTYSHETLDKSSSSTTLKRTSPLLQEKQEPLHEDLFCSQRTDCQSMASNVATAQSFTNKESTRTTTDNNPSSSNTSTDRPTLSSRFSNQSTPTPVTIANITSHVAGSRVIEFSKKSKELRVNVTSKEQKDPTQPSISSINTHPSLPRLKSFKPVARQTERPKLKELSASFDKPTSMTLDSGYQHHRSRGSHGRPMNSNYEQTNQNLAIIDMLRNKKYTLKAEIKRENSPSTEMDSSNTGYSSIPPACEQSGSTCTNKDVYFHRPKLSSLLAPSSRSSSLPVAVVHPSSSTTTREPDNQAKPPQQHEPQTTVGKPPQQHDPQTIVSSMLPSLSYSQATHCTMSATEAERLQNRRKGIARLQRLTSIKDTVRLVLQPFYNHHEISRTEFKDIFIRAVQKVNESNSDVNYHRIADLVKKYVKKYKGLRPQLTDLQTHTL